MRILHVDPERGWGGGQVQVMGLMHALAERGIAQRLAADPAGRLAREAAALRVEVVPLRIRNHGDVGAALRLRRLARTADLVHFHTARAHAMAPLVGPVRRVVTRRMDYVPRGGPYVRWLYNRTVDRVIAISHGVRATLLAAGVAADRIRVVASGVDPEALRAAPEARTRERLGWKLADAAVCVVLVGVLEPRKGHAVLLDALRTMAAAGVVVDAVFCGDGSLRAPLTAAAAAMPVPVHVLGFRTDVANVLAAADVAVLPSLHEGLGIAALEAMAMGRPLVASRVGGLAETVVDGVTGLLVPPGDAAALADALAGLTRDPARRARLAAAGPPHIAAHYTMARMAAGTLACYEELA